MHIIYLAGNSLHNKDWIEKVKLEFDDFSSGTILYYDHWSNGKEFIDVDGESENLKQLIKDQSNYCVFAKSVGSILALKTIYEKTFDPQKIVLCGHPYLLAKKMGLPIDTYLESLKIPITFIQNEHDPLYSFSDLEKTLKEHSPAHFSLVKNEGTDSHDYEDYPKLAEIVQNFFS